MLFLTPLSFTVSVVRDSRLLVDRLAFGFGLVLAPILTVMSVNLDLIWSGAIGGSLAYLVHRLRKAAR